MITGIEVIRGGRVVDVPVGKPLEVSYGDSIRVKVSFKYRGKAIPVTLYGAVVNWPLNEVAYNEATIELPASLDFETYVQSIVIPITEGLSVGSGYNLQCKIEEYPENADEVSGVIAVTEPEAKGVSWLPWAVIGGVVIIGAGAAVALSGRRK